MTLSHKLYLTTSHSNRVGKVSPRKIKRTIVTTAAIIGTKAAVITTTARGGAPRETASARPLPLNLKVPPPLPLTKTIIVVVGRDPGRRGAAIRAAGGEEMTLESGEEPAAGTVAVGTAITGLEGVPTARAGDTTGGLTRPLRPLLRQANLEKATLPLHQAPLRQGAVLAADAAIKSLTAIINLLHIGITKEIDAAEATPTKDGDPCLTARCIPTFKSAWTWWTRRSTKASQVSDFTTAFSGNSAPPNKYRTRTRTPRTSTRTQWKTPPRPSLARTSLKRRSAWLPPKR